MIFYWCDLSIYRLVYSYCAAMFVVLICDEAKESFAIVLTTSRCHFEEMVTGHRYEALISFCQRLRSLVQIISGTSDPG